MRQDKQKAIELRTLGKSYSQISKELNVPKGTLSEWFKNSTFSISIKEENILKANADSAKKIAKMHEARKSKLFLLYKNAEDEAIKSFLKYKNDPLFIAGLMLYAGEGDKQTKNGLIRISNSEMLILKIFKNFIVKYIPDSKNRIKFWMLLYPNLDENTCKKEWANFLHLEDKNFYKTQVIVGKSKKRSLLFGVGNIIFNSKLEKTRLLKWIELMYQELKVEKLDAGIS